MLRVKVLSPSGWQSGTVLAAGAIALDGTNEAIPLSKVRAVAHDLQRQRPHEAPDPQEFGWLVLLGVIFFEHKRLELEQAAGWRDEMGHYIKTVTNSCVPVLAVVTPTMNGVLVAD